MITIPAYLAILVLSTLLTVIVIQWRTKTKLHARMIEHAVMWQLSCGEATTLEIRETFRRLYRSDLHLVKTYVLLDRLEKAGIVTRRVGEIIPERGNRPRIYYRFTDEKGRAARAIEQ